MMGLVIPRWKKKALYDSEWDYGAPIVVRWGIERPLLIKTKDGEAISGPEWSRCHTPLSNMV